jgi:HAD superfamily hydrolase (TIGR01490 family)
MRAAFFDLDGTLWPVSVEKSFAGHLANMGVLKKRQLGAVLWSYLRYELGMFSDHDAFKTAAIRELFAHVEPDQIETLYLEYFNTTLKPKFYRDMIRRANDHKLAGEKVVIISASLAFMVKPVAAYLGATASYGTELEVISDRYTGEVYGRIHYAEKKMITVQEYANANECDLALCYAYGDRFEDRYMLGLVGHPVAVNPGRKLLRFANLRNWDVVQTSNV